jgi:hypothetical protein
MAISGDVFRINQVYELLQEGQWPKTFFTGVGWIGGGTDFPSPSPGSPTSKIDRVDFSADTSGASVRGPLSSARYGLAATGNDNFGWFGGGIPGPVSRVDRIDFSVDTSTASERGPLSLARNRLAATGNDNFGWFGGGNPGPVSRVDRIDFSSDAGITSTRGPLSLARYYLAAIGNDNFGWFGGGGLPISTIVDRITFTDDTVTASVRGPLSSARYYLAAVGNDNFGWFGGGQIGPGTSNIMSTIDRVDFSVDTSTASVRTNLNIARTRLMALNNKEYGWFAGGFTPGVFGTATIERIFFVNDTAGLSFRGLLSSGRRESGGTSAVRQISR